MEAGTIEKIKDIFKEFEIEVSSFNFNETGNLCVNAIYYTGDRFYTSYKEIKQLMNEIENAKLNLKLIDVEIEFDYGQYVIFIFEIL